MNTTEHPTDAAAREIRLTEANAAYHRGEPVMSDSDYDRLWHEHMADRREHPDDPVWESSILDRVGAAPEGGFRKVTHDPPMGSLENVFAADTDVYSGLLPWIKRCREAAGGDVQVRMEPKIDGAALRVVYEDGKLRHAVTRGDGRMGDDVTAGVLAADLVPESLPDHFPTRLAANLEVFMTFDEFERLNRERQEAGEPLLANPRNAAAGALRLHDTAEIARRGLRAFVHDVVVGVEFNYQELANRMAAVGFLFPPHGFALLTKDAIPTEEIAGFMLVLSTLNYPIDGVVFKVAPLGVREAMGWTSRTPRWAVAFKFDQEQATTTLTGIRAQVGRSGAITPVAELGPVQLDGSVVRKATLHNEAQITRLGLSIGCNVTIQKAGGIIPEIVSCDSPVEGTFDLIAHLDNRCPSCGGALERLSEVSVICPASATCPAQMVTRLTHMADRRRLNLTGLGEEVAIAVTEEGVSHPFDVLTWSVERLAALTWTTQSGGTMTFGNSRAARLRQAMAAAPNLPLHCWIAALGIPHVGDNTSREVARLVESRDGLLASCRREGGLFHAMNENADGAYARFKEGMKVSHHLGPVSIASLVGFVGDPANLSAVMRIPEQVRAEKVEKTGGALNGKTFVVTGTLSSPRDEIKNLITMNGGKVSGSVTKSTDYLVAGEKPGSKLDKARDLGVSILCESELRELIGNG